MCLFFNNKTHNFWLIQVTNSLLAPAALTNSPNDPLNPFHGIKVPVLGYDWQVVLLRQRGDPTVIFRNRGAGLIRIQNHFHICGSTDRKSRAFRAFCKSAAADAERRGKSCTQCLEESRLEGESSNTFLKLCSMRFPNVCPRKAAYALACRNRSSEMVSVVFI